MGCRCITAPVGGCCWLLGDSPWSLAGFGCDNFNVRSTTHFPSLHSTLPSSMFCCFALLMGWPLLRMSLWADALVPAWLSWWLLQGGLPTLGYCCLPLPLPWWQGGKWCGACRPSLNSCGSVWTCTLQESAFACWWLRRSVYGRGGGAALFRTGLVLRLRRSPGVRASVAAALLVSTSWATAVCQSHARVAAWGLPTCCGQTFCLASLCGAFWLAARSVPSWPAFLQWGSLCTQTTTFWASCTEGIGFRSHPFCAN